MGAIPNSTKLFSQIPSCFNESQRSYINLYWLRIWLAISIPLGRRKIVFNRWQILMGLKCWDKPWGERERWVDWGQVKWSQLHNKYIYHMIPQFTTRGQWPNVGNQVRAPSWGEVGLDRVERDVLGAQICLVRAPASAEGPYTLAPTDWAGWCISREMRNSTWASTEKSSVMLPS